MAYTYYHPIMYTHIVNFRQILVQAYQGIFVGAQHYQTGLETSQNKSRLMNSEVIHTIALCILARFTENFME